MGVVPTLKSELEAGVVQSLAEWMDGGQQGALWETRLSRFEEGARTDSELGRLAALLFSKVALGQALLVFAALGLLGIGLEIGSAKATSWFGKEIFRRLRAEGLQRALATSSDSHAEKHNAPGQFAMAIQQGATNAQSTYEYILEALQQIVAIATVVALLATRSHWLAVLCFALVGMQATISFVQARRLSAARVQMDARRNALAASTDDILSKRELILVHEREGHYGAKLDEQTRELAELDRVLSVSESKYKGLSSLMTDYGKVALLLVAVFLAWRGDGVVQGIGDAYFIAALYMRLFVPVASLLSRYDAIRRSEATSRSYLQLLAQPAGPGSSKAAPETVLPEGVDAELREVSYRYPGAERPVLTDCSFTVPRGSVTMLLGPSGCGKTTIARLMLGFLQPDSGKLLLDGVDAEDLGGTRVRGMMSYVSQGDFIIDDTVRDNLSWAAPTPSDDRIMGVLRRLRVIDGTTGAEFLDLPARRLSVGQQQRLSLSRLLLDTAPLVIMDEPLSGVDVFTLRDVMPAVIDAIKETSRTVLIITHRVSLISSASHAVVLGQDARVVEEGEPLALLADPTSLLADLYRVSMADLRVGVPA